MKQIKQKPIISFFGLIIAFYMMSVSIMFCYYWWKDVKANDSFIRAVFWSPIVGVFKATHWPYYTFFQRDDHSGHRSALTDKQKDSVQGFFAAYQYLQDIQELAKGMPTSKNPIADLGHVETLINYTFPESLLAGFIREMIKQTQALNDQGREPLSDIFRFIKPYKGPLWRVDGIKEDVIFYNEREWRYIPNEHKLLLKEGDFLNESERKKFNDDISCNDSIPFAQEDVRYLIVSGEREILPLVNDLEKLKSKFGDDQIITLTTRIIAAERIREDF